MPKSVPIVFALLLVTIASSAQDLSSYEKILLPAYTSKPLKGVGGSLFETALTLYSERETSYFGCGFSESIPSFHTQQASNPAFFALICGPASASGRFLYVKKTDLQDLAIGYHLRSRSGDAAPTYLTALPVVQTPLVGITRILSIPVTPIITFIGNSPVGQMSGYQQRSTLRIYDFDGDGSGEVTVEQFDAGQFGRLGSIRKTTVKLDQQGGDDPTFPYFGQLDLNECLPFSAHTPCRAYGARIEIIPVSPGLRYWAFVSTTDNETNQVSVFASQPGAN